MKGLKTLFSTGAALLIPLLGFAGTSEQVIKDRMKSDLDVIRNAFEVSYAPKEWKKSYADWDLDAEIQKAKEKIQASDKITIKSYQKIVRDFFNSTKDYHVGVWFYSTERASLPFRVKGAEGRYFISNVDTSRLSPSVYPINVGDELVMFDGQTADAAISEIMKNEFRSANEATDRAFAEYILTNRLAQFGHTVPKGPIMIGIKPVGSARTSTYQLIWTYSPEKISNGFMGSLADQTSSDVAVDESLLHEKFFNKKMVMPFFEVIRESSLEKGKKEQAPKDQAANEFIGSRESFIPTLGRTWWENHKSSPFKAYLYENDDHKLIGYVRIPHFVGYDQEVNEFASIISFFEERSDALVIDQVNNPGGYVFYAYALASLLTDQPLYTPKHRMTITQEDVAFAVSAIPILEKINTDADAQALLGSSFFGMPVTHQMTQFFLNYLNFIVSEWNAGRTLTEPYFLYSIDHINPHPSTRYTKPILLLVNSLDMSGGDFFPAIMQDNKRVTTFGTRTAGAGGYIIPESFPNRFGIAGFSYTASIAERINKNPIENLGVTPDIPYEVSVADLQGHYRGYVDAVNQAVANLLGSSSPSDANQVDIEQALAALLKDREQTPDENQINEPSEKVQSESATEEEYDLDELSQKVESESFTEEEYDLDELSERVESESATEEEYDLDELSQSVRL